MSHNPPPFKMSYIDQRPTAVMDTECYINYWSIGFRDVAGNRIKHFEKWNDGPLNTAGIAKIMRQWRIITFNGNGYDSQMLAMAMSGASNAMLKKANDALIPGSGLRGMSPKQFYEYFKVRRLPAYCDQIDLQEVSPGSPGMPSLKLYAGRLHSRRMQELPFDHTSVIDADMRTVLEDYRDNDLDVTRDLYLELKPQIEIRARMSDQYKTDLRSKSDAQTAEAVIRTEIERITGKKIWSPDIVPGKFRYKVPEYIKFKTPELQALVRNLETHDFRIDQGGRVHEPEFLKKQPITLGDSTYTIGIGGLHSKEKASWHVADENFILLDRDVTSYYPSIILLLGLFPKHLGRVFLKVLRKIFDRRVDAKERARLAEIAGDMVAARGFADIAETLKIVLNGCFGKFGSPFSCLFAPDLMIQVTVTGQLSVLMLIEELVLRRFGVISANTDGFVTKVAVERRDEFNALLMEWEWDTGLQTEETQYKWLYSANVNNYIALDVKDKVKRKGKSATPAGPGLKGASGMKKNPHAEICIEAVVAYVKDGTPMADTVHYCEDIKKFLCVTRCKAPGAEKDGVRIAKDFRFYYSTETKTAIHKVENGHVVPGTMGAVPCMQLPDEFPEDIDYDWYIRECYAILEGYGVDVIDPKLAGRTGLFTGRLEDQKTYHSVRLPSGVAVCGKKPASMRETWIEEKVNREYRFCTKCVKGGDI